jgi:hypothetical protein
MQPSWAESPVFRQQIFLVNNYFGGLEHGWRTRVLGCKRDSVLCVSVFLLKVRKVQSSPTARLSTDLPLGTELNV